MPAGASVESPVGVSGLGSTFAPCPVTVPSVMRVGVDCSMGVWPGSPDGLLPTSRLYPYSSRLESSRSHTVSAATAWSASVPPGTVAAPAVAPAAAPAVPPTTAPAPMPTPAPTVAPTAAPAAGPAAAAMTWQGTPICGATTVVTPQPTSPQD